MKILKRNENVEIEKIIVETGLKIKNVVVRSVRAEKSSKNKRCY